jgi:hypothetical protein
MLATHSLIVSAISIIDNFHHNNVAIENPFTTFFSRKTFFSENLYIIGGEKYSLDDIENGILRSMIVI